MTRIKFKDLPKDKKISDEEMKHVTGGMLMALGPEGLRRFSASESLLSGRAERLRSINQMDRINLPNMMHDAGP